MKNIGKIKAIIISSIVALVTIVGLVFSFIPMNFGDKDFESFAGALSQSSSISGGISVEYNIKSSGSDEEINNSINHLTSLISEYDGFKSVTAYKKGESTIRVDLSEPVLVADRTKSEEFLTSLATGKLVFKNKNDATATLTPPEGQEVDPTLIVIEANKHIEKISKISTGTAKGIKIDFNKEGRNLYAKATGMPLYMFVGGVAWPNANGNEISANTDPSSTSMYLMFNSEDVVDNYYYILKAGMMSIELDAEKVEVVYNTNKTATLFKVAGIVTTVMVILGLMVLAIIKQKGFALPVIISSLVMIAVELFLLQAMNWVTFGFTSLIAIILMSIVTYVLNAIIYKQLKAEYAIGKSLATATDDAYRKNMWMVVDTLAVTLILGLILAVTTTGELVGVGTIFALTSLILAVNTLLFNRLMLNCIFSINEKTEAFFGLNPRKEANDEKSI